MSTHDPSGLFFVDTRTGKRTPVGQLPLDYTPPVGQQFAGPGYEPAKDQARWSRHCAAVLAVLQRGGWWTYEALAEAAQVPVGSCRTRVSNLKAAGQNIETRTRPDRFREVRLVRP